ncbi:hypothetical protein Bca4012_008682 [Brassica carinata]
MKKETSGLSLRRSARGTTTTTPTSSTSKSERRTPSPVSVSKKSAKMEKKHRASPLRRSNKGKSDTSSSERKVEAIDNVVDLTGEVKKRYEPRMSGRSYRALYRRHLKKEADASSVDDELVVVGCSRRVPAGNDEARDGNSSSPRVNSESKGLLVAVKLARDTENMVLDSSPMVGDDSVISSPSENPVTQKLRVSETSLETDVDLPLKRKRDTAETVMDACANADDRIMSPDGVIPSPSGCTNNNQPESRSTCQKGKKKVSDDFENLRVSSCIAQPVQEPDHLAQESGPASNRDGVENRHDTRQDKSYDPKLSLVYPEYWVPVQLSDIQIEQYCRTLFSNSLSLSSQSRIDYVGALEKTLTSVKKTCDHPYVMDAYLKPLLTKNLKLHELVDVEVKASGKLHLLDAMLTQIKTKGLKAVVFYQSTQSPEGLLLANILDDFVGQRFGQNSYEHGVCHSTKNAINNFNKESECFILLLETRACSQSIKLLRAEALILFRSSLNTSHDVKLLEKIKIETYSERTKIFRLYSIFTVEEKALILARQKNSLDNLSRPLTHALLMWGASYLFGKLDQFHGSQTSDPGVPVERSIRGDVIREFSSILSSSVREGNVGKLCLLSEAKHVQGTYSIDSTLFGEKYVELSDEVSPNIFWAKLLDGKNPVWKYHSDTSQRSRKRVRHLQVSEETAKLDDGKHTKKKKKASDDVTVVYDVRKASGKDHMGDLESPKVRTVQSSGGSASGTNAALNGKDAIGLYSVGGHISGIPEDMLAAIDCRQTPGKSQKKLHTVLKPQMAKLCQVLHLSIWIAVSFVKQKFNREESLVRAKSELGFNCSREEVDYIYSFLYCMKSLFVGRTQGFQEKGEECMAEKRGSQYSSVAKDVEKTISDIKKKCSKSLHKLVQTLEEKKMDLMNRNADKKQELQNCKKVEASFIRVTYLGISTQSLHDALQRLERTFERKFDDLKGELDECLESLEKICEAAKKKLAEDEACWISRIEKWALAELRNGAPIQSGNNKHLSGLCSSNAPDVQTCNDASGEATYAETNCKVPEAETTIRTMSGGSTQRVHEVVASRNDKAMYDSTLSHEQPTENVATKSQPSEHLSITAPEILKPAGCQEEFAALNVQLSEYQIRDKVTSATPDEDVPSRVPASLDPSLNREEVSVSVENDRTVQAGSNADNILDQQNEEACSLDNEIPDELALPLPHPVSLVKTRGSAESDQVDHEICHMPSSPGGKQPDPAENFQGENIESAIEARPAGSPMHSSPGGKQPDLAANIQGNNIEATNELQSAESSIPSSPAGQQSEPAANSQGKNIEATIELQPAESSMPSSPAGQQSDAAVNILGNNIETATEPQPAESSMPSSPARGQSDPAANSQGKNIETAIEPQPAISPVPSSPAGQQSDPAANIQGKNLETAIEPQPAASHVPSSPAEQQSDPAVNNQGKNIEPAIEPQPAESSMPSSQGGKQPDTAEKIQGKDIEETVDSQPARSETLETGGFAASEQVPLAVGGHVACLLQSSPAGNQPDPGAESQNISTSAEPHIAGPGAVSDQELMDAQDASSLPSPSVDTQADIAANTEGQNITTVSDAAEADNVAPLVHEGVVESSAGVTAPVPSLLNNATATTGQNLVQPVPQIPFPVFSDPFQHELEKLRRLSEITKKTCEEKKAELKARFERKITELQEEYQRKFREVQAEHAAIKTKLQTRKNLVVMNKLLSSAFLSKCTSRTSSHSSAAPMGKCSSRIQQLAQRAAQVGAPRNHTASTPSVSRPSDLPLTSTYCTMPQTRHPLIPNTLTYSTALLQQHEQQQNLGSGLQKSNDVEGSMNWLPDEEFKGLSDSFFDDLINHINFPLEDTTTNGVDGEDWDTKFQHLEPPPMDLFTTFPSEFTSSHVINKEVACVPVLKQSSTLHQSSPPDIKVSKLFQSSSPVSVLESSDTSFSPQSLISQSLAFPVKGMRSKRKRPTTQRFRYLYPFETSKHETHYSSEQHAKNKKRKTILHTEASSYDDGIVRRCTHCETTKTPQWREGPNGPKTLCNACGVRFRSGRLVPEYRPASSPTFIPSLHSNSHRKIIEMRRKEEC